MLQAKQLAQIFNGTVKTEKSFSVCKSQMSFKFSCQNEHTFSLPVDVIMSVDLEDVSRRFCQAKRQMSEIMSGNSEQIKDQKSNLEGCWCPKCVDFYNHNVQQIAIHNKLEVIGGLFTTQIVYKCKSQGHVFQKSSLRK